MDRLVMWTLGEAVWLQAEKLVWVNDFYLGVLYGFTKTVFFVNCVVDCIFFINYSHNNREYGAG